MYAPLSLADHDIGVISPYNAQGKKLRLRLNAEYIKVGSVEEFQGQVRHSQLGLAFTLD